MLGKVLMALVGPLGTALLFGMLALLLASAGHVSERGPRAAARSARGFARTLRRLGLGCGVFACFWLALWSTPVVSDALRGWIEAQAGPAAVEALPRCEVAVVLGGGLSGPRLPNRPYPDLAASADRVWHAARLFHANKAGRLLLSGGEVHTGDGSEAEAMAVLLRDLGVPRDRILFEAASINTVTNAERTRAALKPFGPGCTLLVTSALHMRRAKRAFERAGLEVQPAPTDFEIIPMPFDVLRVLPSAYALQGSTRAFKELIGPLFGR